MEQTNADSIAKALASRPTGIANLAKAYVAAWGEIDNVVKNAKNPHLGNNYADLSACLDTVRPVFAKHKLALLTAPGEIVTTEKGEVRMTLLWMLFHESGESVNGRMSLPVSTDKKGAITAQAGGSAITYMRRYLLAAIGGITQVDDDGSAASSGPGKKEKAAPQGDDYQATVESYKARISGCGTVAELDALLPELKELGSQEVADAFRDKKRELKAKPEVS